MTAPLLAGAARRDITPPVGTHLYGYYPGLVSTAVLDPLNITAAAFTDTASGQTALLLTATVCEIQTELDCALRSDLANICGIPAEHILLSATHTHCGPNMSGSEGWGEIDRPYVDEVFRPAMLEAAQNAMDIYVTESLLRQIKSAAFIQNLRLTDWTQSNSVCRFRSSDMNGSERKCNCL